MAYRPRPPLALTPGEPAGIGAEIAAMAWRDGTVPPFYTIDDPDRLRRRTRAAGLDIPVAPIGRPAEAPAAFAAGLPVLARAFPVDCPPGAPDPANAAAVAAAIEEAVAAALAGEASAVVTAPIHKHTLRRAGFPHPGHTEFLAELAGGGARPVMMLASDALRVVPVTIHEALRDVPDLLTADLVVETARTAAAALRRDFGIARPRLAAAGLNPHAGESGSIGREDAAVVAPALAALRAEGIDIAGPLAADSMFHPAARARYDAALCMYHDQALIPVKTLDFHGAVNVTLGLPVVRTSPDHGTALDIAGTGRADPRSLVAALRLADAIARRRAA